MILSQSRVNNTPYGSPYTSPPLVATYHTSSSPVPTTPPPTTTKSITAHTSQPWWVKLACWNGLQRRSRGVSFIKQDMVNPSPTLLQRIIVWKFSCFCIRSAGSWICRLSMTLALTSHTLPRSMAMSTSFGIYINICHMTGTNFLWPKHLPPKPPSFI
eukprot:PhF_6_TR12652/c0_g1_i1/m.20103